MMIPPIGNKKANASPMIAPCAICACSLTRWLKPGCPTDPPELWLAAVAVGKPADAVPLPVACAEAKNGLRELPPFAFWRLKFRFPMMSCWERLAVWLSDFGELPLNAHIQAVLLAVRSILPVSQLAQLEPIIGPPVLLTIARPDHVLKLIIPHTANIGSHNAIDDARALQQRHLSLAIV